MIEMDIYPRWWVSTHIQRLECLLICPGMSGLETAVVFGQGVAERSQDLIRHAALAGWEKDIDIVVRTQRWIRVEQLRYERALEEHDWNIPPFERHERFFESSAQRESGKHSRSRIGP
jgi:hypothetical protein